MKSISRRVLESVDEQERQGQQEAPPVDALNVHTAGTTITTDVPSGAAEEPGDVQDVSPEELDVEMDVVPPELPEPEEEPAEELVAEREKGFKDLPADKAVHGGMSLPHKMPCITYSMLAGATCPEGRKLAQVPGSVCYGCYAFGGNYGRPNVINAMRRRARLTKQALTVPGRLDAWIDAIVASVDKSGDDVFRWHDSGDIMGQNHLESIVEVARRKPNVRFWLPTKEHGTVNNWLSTYGAKAMPRNLNIRISAHMLFETVPSRPPLTSSSVASGEGYPCPATWDKKYKKRFDNTCGPCRACWDRKTRNVDYGYHGAQYIYRRGLLTHGLLEPRKGRAPEKPRGWEPTPKAQAKAMRGVLPKVPGPVRRIIRPD